MKINRIKAKNKRKRYIKSCVLECFFFILLIGMLAGAVVGISSLVSGGLFTLVQVSPSDMQLFNYNITTKTIEELIDRKQYGAVVNLMEVNKKLMDSSPDLKLQVSDCYRHTGNYSKAIGLLSEVERDTAGLGRLGLVGLKMLVYTRMYDIYELTGDYPSQKRYIDLVYSSYMSIKNDVPEEYEAVVTPGIEYRRNSVLYHENKQEATGKMQQLADTLFAEGGYRQGTTLMQVYNRLIQWNLDASDTVSGRRNLKNAIALASTIRDEREIKDIAGFADYCFALGDTTNGEKLIKMFSRYLSYFYDKKDLYYLTNITRKYRYDEINGRADDVISHLKDDCRNLRAKIVENFAGMSEEQREYINQQIRQPFDYSMHLLLKYDTPELRRLVLENMIFSQGLLLRTDNYIRNALKGYSSTGLPEKYDTLIQCRKNLIACNSMGGIGNTYRAYQLKDSIKQLETELSASVKSFKEIEEVPDVADIQKKLARDEAVAELFECEDGLHALLLKHDGIVYRKLCGKKEVAEVLDGNINAIYSDTKITKKLIGNMLGSLGGIRKIYYCTNGIFNQISLPALYLGGGEYLADKLDMNLISNPQDIIKKKNSMKTVASIMLWGGIDYGGEASRMTAASHRGIQRGDSLGYLPNTLTEVTSISDLFPAVSRLFTGYEATERSFKDNARVANIIHIATHGFFQEDEKHKRTSAMYNTGLFFADANIAWTADSIQQIDPDNDGILRAIEIAQMDLSRCGLVVLSACETGLGYIDGNEGVYGLQRAFRQAGAGSIIMSLWKVEDAPTEMLMSAFYGYVEQGLGYEEAFKKSRAELRQKWPRPKDWGAFVLLN